jgi:hypothetical protein
MRADQVDANSTRETEVKAARCFVFAPRFGAKLLDSFFQLQGVGLDGNFDVADGVAAGQIPDGISGEKKERPRLPGHFAQLPQGILLIG